jgi:hypothetical protein
MFAPNQVNEMIEYPYKKVHGSRQCELRCLRYTYFYQSRNLNLKYSDSPQKITSYTCFVLTKIKPVQRRTSILHILLAPPLLLISLITLITAQYGRYGQVQMRITLR